MTERNDQQLLDQLLSKTRAGKLSWEVADDNEFVTAVGGEYSVTIQKAPRFENFWLSLRDAAGSELIQMRYTDDQSEWPELPQLFELARRSALQVGRKVDDLISQLSRL